MQDRSSSVRQLHLLLGIAGTATAAVFVVLTYLGVAPLLRDADTEMALIAYGLSAASVTAAAVALLFFRVKIPARTLGQTDAEFWSTAPVPDSALLVWGLLEGAVTLAAVAFVLTGHVVPTVLMPLALMVYWLQGPSALARG